MDTHDKIVTALLVISALLSLSVVGSMIGVPMFIVVGLYAKYRTELFEECDGCSRQVPLCKCETSETDTASVEA